MCRGNMTSLDWTTLPLTLVEVDEKEVTTGIDQLDRAQS